MQKIFLVLFALFVLVSMQGGMGYAAQKKMLSNIVLITVDTLRADHLSCYGYYRKTSPNIDRIAAQGIVCRTVFAPSSWTAPSMTSLFTSVYPISHGVIHGIGLDAEQAIYVQETISPRLKTLAEILRENGYTTFGVTAHKLLNEHFGFARGFDYFTCLEYSPAQEVNEAVYAMKEAIKQAGKFFLWIHYFDPHSPYIARMPWAREYARQVGTEVMFDLPSLSGAELASLIQKCPDGGLPDAMQPLCEHLKGMLQHYKDNDINPQDHNLALYDSEISYVDAHIGMLMKHLNPGDDTLIVITADHGEEFMEHGELGHGHNLYQAAIHIPLLVKLPHRKKSVVLNQPISLTDVMPSILHIVGIDPPPECVGKPIGDEQTMLSWLKKKMTGVDINYVYSEIETRRSLTAIVAAPWKYIYNAKDKTGQLFNIVSDPFELHDCSGVKTGERDQLKEQLFHWMETSRRYPTTHFNYELSPEEKEKLKGLGYL